MNVADLMTRNVVTVGPGTSVRHAAELMLAHRVSGLPVVDDDGAVVGLVTEGDLLRRAELGGVSAAGSSAEDEARGLVKSQSWRIADVMAVPVVSVTEATAISEVVRLLDTHGIKRLPVLRDGHLVGIVSRADLLHCIADARPERIAQGDDALRISVAARLREARDTIGDLPTVTVRDGVVHLWGSVGSIAARDAARVVAESAPGAGDCSNHLTVTPPEAD